MKHPLLVSLLIIGWCIPPVWAGDLQHRWSFGDGQFSTEKDPDYHYAQPGIYEVTLDILQNNLVIATRKKTVDLITPLIQSVNIDHQINDLHVQLLANIQFKEQISNLPFQYIWYAEDEQIAEGNHHSIRMKEYRYYNMRLDILFNHHTVHSQHFSIELKKPEQKHSSQNDQSGVGVIGWLMTLLLFFSVKFRTPLSQQKTYIE